MITRELPRDEYFRLIGTELEAVRDLLPPTAIVLVVESDEGELVGCLALLPLWHADSVWVAEHERRRDRVVRCLWRGLQDVAAQHGAKSVIAGATLPKLDDMIRRLGGQQIPGMQFVLPMET